MTRSELKIAIEYIGAAISQSEVILGKKVSSNSIYSIIHSVLLAEQKRSEGCEFCRNKENEHGFFIDGNVLFYEDGKLGTEGIIITTCPRCGRDLTEGESV